VVEQTLMTVLCGGHALLVGVPGLAKTKLVETLGTCSASTPAASSSRPT
jgi:MoxR-like ATPase